jgi:hypothetical protein
MAEATSAFIGDALMTYSNPAGLAHLSQPEASAQHTSHFEGAFADNLTVVLPYKRGGWGVSVGMAGVRDIPRTRAVPSSVSIDRFVEDGEVKAGAYWAAGSWGRRQTQNLAWGATFRAASESIDSQSALAALADAGVIYRFNRRWRGAAVVQNVGVSGKLSAEETPVPARARLAAHWTPERWVQWELDAVMNRNGPWELLAGGEMHWNQIVFLRGGYRFTEKTTDLGATTGVSAGVGVQAATFRADYAFLPFGDLGDSHRVSLSWRFGENP